MVSAILNFMYKYLVVGLTFLIITFSGWYIIKLGGGELIRNAFLGAPEQTTLNTPTIESVVGIYSCDKTTGCQDKYVILLREDQTIEFLSSSDPSSQEELKQEDEDTVEIIDNEVAEPTAQEIERSRIVFLDENTKPEDLPTPESSIITIEDGASSTMPTSTEAIIEPSSSFGPTAEEAQVFENITSLTELEESSKAAVEKGTWSFGGGNILIITLTQVGETEYNTPQKLIIKKIGASTLSNISYDKLRYKQMVKPVFVKLEG